MAAGCDAIVMKNFRDLLVLIGRMTCCHGYDHRDHGLQQQSQLKK
jgi:hypothetical protein